MNELNTLFGKARSFANAVGKKTGEVVETSKVKLQMVSVNGEISRAYEEIGSLVYHAAKNNQSCGQSLDAKMAEIDSCWRNCRIWKAR